MLVVESISSVFSLLVALVKLITTVFVVLLSFISGTIFALGQLITFIPNLLPSAVLSYVVLYLGITILIRWVLNRG